MRPGTLLRGLLSLQFGSLTIQDQVALLASGEDPLLYHNLTKRQKGQESWEGVTLFSNNLLLQGQTHAMRPVSVPLQVMSS
jgi:hypothetical protein